MVRASSVSSPLTAAAGAALVAALVLAALPMAGATSATGVWIFPHSHRADAVADSLSDSFYIGDSENPWLQDSYFADSLSDSANISVDLYNPTSGDLSNVQVFAAYSVDNLALVTSISFAGGSSGAVSYSGDDLASGGTPSLAGGASLDAHDIYPAYFVSYGVGDLAAGSSNIRSIWVNVSGDFASGLIVHLDYTAEDASGNPVSGPFTADMNIFENGDSEVPPCEASLVEAGPFEEGVQAESLSPYAAPVAVSGGDGATDIALAFTFPLGTTLKDPTAGTVSGRVWTWKVGSGSAGDKWNESVTIGVSALLIDGDMLTIVGDLSWTSCGEANLVPLENHLKVQSDPKGDAHSASWWDEQAEKTKKGGKKAEFSSSEFDLLLQRVALHSDVFTYPAWNGTAPTGDKDAGWVGIDSLADAMKVFDKKTAEAKRVRGAEREDLALWLNIANGAVNRDTSLMIWEKKHKCKGHGSEFEDQTGLSSLPAAYDTPGEIAAFLEKEIKDWKGGNGSSTADLKLAKRLARAVNSEWLVAA